MEGNQPDSLAPYPGPEQAEAGATASARPPAGGGGQQHAPEELPTYWPPTPPPPISVAREPAAASRPTTSFPARFGLYRSKGGEGGNRSFHVGEHDAQPLYAVSVLSRGTPRVVLHASRDASAPRLALVECEFEWRHSGGEAIRDLGGRPAGWKLVRLGAAGRTSVARRHSGAGPEMVRVAERVTASDGNEVVALWSTARWSYPKCLRFRFVESGATGAMGRRWALITVGTMLGVWESERFARFGGAAGDV